MHTAKCIVLQITVKLGTGDDKLFGLAHTDIEELKERYQKDKLSTADCKSIRTKPLLLIYEVNATLEGKTVFKEKPVSFGVFLPEIETKGDERDISVTYSANKIARQLDLQLPEDDGDEAFELNALQER